MNVSQRWRDEETHEWWNVIEYYTRSVELSDLITCSGMIILNIVKNQTSLTQVHSLLLVKQKKSEQAWDVRGVKLGKIKGWRDWRCSTLQRIKEMDIRGIGVRGREEALGRDTMKKMRFVAQGYSAQACKKVLRSGATEPSGSRVFPPWVPS